MRIAICDDNPAEARLLAKIIEDFAAGEHQQLQLSLFSDSEDMLAAAQANPFALYFLDIIMPGMDGIAAAREIRAADGDACIVFLSTSNDFAYQSYRVQASDYLLKPADKVQVEALLRRLQAQIAESSDCICIQRGRGFMRLPAAQLSYLEINQKQLYFYLADGQVRQVPGTLAEYEPELLSRSEFVKIHRSYIVNLRQVAQLSPDGCVMFSGKSLPISRLMYEDVRKAYMAHLFGAAEG